jgi:hypothetical protein
MMLALLVLGGCALVPNSLPVGVEHVSHLGQHEPFTSDCHRYGYNAAYLGARWNAGNASFTVQEAVAIGQDSLPGDRDIFSARIEYAIPLKGRGHD